MGLIVPQGAGSGGGRAQLVAFREGWYACLERRADALFELTDALLCTDGPMNSFPHLSLEPEFRRGWGSGYAALARGRVDMEAVRDLLVAHRPPDWPLVFAVDASTMERCDAETSPDRGFYYHASKHSAGQPIVAGWSYQWITQLNGARDSWTAPLDARRLHPCEDSVRATVAQVRELVRRLGDSDPVPLFVFDAGYDPIALSHELRDDRAAVLVRIKGDRVFYGDPPQRKVGTIGRPRRHGKRFDCKQAASWPAPDRELVCADGQYGKVVVQAWSGLHPKLNTRGHWAGLDEPPIVRGTVIRVQVERLPKPNGRALKTLWLWWSGPGQPDLDLCWRAYIRRFDIEHTIRFSKNTLGWTTPSLRHPERADRWTMVNLAALTQLRLARPVVADRRMPWERPRDQDRLTPTRVRRGFRCICATFPLVANPPKPAEWGLGGPRVLVAVQHHVTRPSRRPRDRLKRKLRSVRRLGWTTSSSPGRGACWSVGSSSACAIRSSRRRASTATSRSELSLPSDCLAADAGQWRDHNVTQPDSDPRALQRAATWNVDALHSQVFVSVRHMGVANLRAKFPKITGKLVVDPTDPLHSAFELEADTRAVTTGHPPQEDFMRSEHWLDAENHPTLTFRSTSVEPRDGTNYVVRGDLTLRGVTRPVELPLEFHGVVSDPWGLRAGFTSRFTVNRRDFGITWTREFDWGQMAGDDLEVSLDLELGHADESLAQKPMS